MRNSILVCTYFYLLKLVNVESITYIKGIPTPKFTTRKIPLEKWLEKNNWRLAPYGNKEFTKIFKQYKPIIRNKYYYVDDNATDTSIGKYVRALFLTSTKPSSRKPKKKEKIKMANLKLVSENLAKLEADLGITSTTQSTEPTTSTEPYTGVTSRKSASPHFDFNYIEDFNWFLKPLKRLRRNLPNNHMLRRYISSKFENRPLFKSTVENHQQNLNVKPIMSGREISGVLILKRAMNEMKEKYEQKFRSHLRERRDLGKIVRRSTKRPHLSRNFKAVSLKKYRMQARLVQEVAAIQGNITIYPELFKIKQVLDDCEKYNMSTLYYVYNNVAYFGSLPPNLTLITTTQTPKPVTFELGKTKILNIFDNVNKVSPGEVDIPNINLDNQRDSQTAVTTVSTTVLLENIQGKQEHVTEEVNTKATKHKRTRKKKKTNDVEEEGETVTKKTRVKKKTSTSFNESKESKELTKSLNDQLELKNKTRGRKRKARSIDLQEKYVNEFLPSFLFYIYTLEHVRIRRNVENNVNEGNVGDGKGENPKIENHAEGNLNPFGRLKKAIKNSKQNFMSYIRDKKEKIVDMPRRVRFIAKEMYLDGKFFVQELQQVPSRIREDIQEKKEFFSLFWDLMKVLMPVTEKGEKGGTTPEPKIVDDPKKYVRNPEDVVTPDLSDMFCSEHKTMFCSERPERKVTLVEITTKEQQVYGEVQRTTTIIPEVQTTIKTKQKEKLIKHNGDTKHHKCETKSEEAIILSKYLPSTVYRESKTRVTETVILSTHDQPSTINRIHETKKKETIILSNNQQYAGSPRQITHSEEYSTECTHAILKKETYITKILGPDYVPKNTRKADEDSTDSTFQKTTKVPSMEEVLKKVNDKKVFDRIETSFKNKEFMNNMFERVNKEKLSSIAEKMNPGEMFKHLNPETMQRMGNLVKEIDPETIKKMQGLALDAFARKPSTPPNNPLVKKNR